MIEPRWRVLVSCLHLQRQIDKYLDLFSKQGIEIEMPKVDQQLSRGQLLPIIGDFNGVIAGDDEFTAEVFERAERLKVLVKWGVGVDAIDLEAAKRFGIAVFNTPNVFGDEVADVTIGYIIMISRHLHKLDQAVRQGNWPKPIGTSLKGKTLGVIGVGDIGRAVCRRAIAMGMRVLGYDLVSDFRIKGVRFVEFGELLRASDVISLNCALTKDNRHMLGKQEFEMMKKGVFIVNTSRGALIDEGALVEALKRGKVAGAALDVFEVEPLPAGSLLRKFDNCVFGTHNSSNTLEAISRVNDKAVEILINNLEACSS
jgi:D-3-phosphoglycerate dehydrogenase